VALGSWALRVRGWVCEEGGRRGGKEEGDGDASGRLRGLESAAPQDADSTALAHLQASNTSRRKP